MIKFVEKHMGKFLILWTCLYAATYLGIHLAYGG